MPANPALTGGEITALASLNQTAPVYLSYVPDTVVATATVATTPSTFPITQLATTGESGGWTNMKKDQTVVIRGAGGTPLRGYYRVRVASGTGVLYIDEVSNADTGIVAVGLRASGITNSDEITIYERYDLFGVKPYQTSALTIYQDYNIAVGTYNTTPPPIVNCAINTYPGNYHAIVANGGTKAITAMVTVTKWPTSSGSMLTYSWTVPGSWTGVSGTTTATLTATAPVGAFWLYCTVTDSIGGATEIARFVRIHSPADPPVEINVLRDTRDRQSRRLTVRLVQARQAVIPTGAMCDVWSDGTWGGSDVATATHSFTGYAVTKVYANQPGYYEGNIDIAGPIAVLDKTNSYQANWLYNASSSTWEQLPASLCNLNFIIWWLLRWRVANALKCFNFTPYDSTGTTARRKTATVSPGTVYSQLKYLADQYDLNIGSRSDGEIIVAAIPSLLANQIGVVTRATLNYGTWQTLNIQPKIRPDIGSLVATGSATYSDFSSEYQVAAAAPALNTLGQGGGTDSKQNKVYEGQQDCNQRTALLYFMLNNDYGNIRPFVPQNWDVIEPADLTLVHVTNSAANPTTAAVAIDTVPVSVDKQWITGARANITINAEALTSTGTYAETKPVEVPQNNLYDPYVATPIPPTVSPGWGSEDTNPPILDTGSGDIPAIIIFSSDGYVTIGVDS